MRRVVLLLAAISFVAGATASVAAPTPTPSPSNGGVAVVPFPKSTHTNPAHTSIRVGTLPVGKAYLDKAIIVNTRSSAVDLYVYPADGIPARGGGYGYATRKAPMHEIGAWLTLSTSRVTVPASGRVGIDLRLLAPPTAANGVHVGAVVVEPVDTGTGAFQSITRYAMPLTVTTTGGITPTRGPSPRPVPLGSGPVTVTNLTPHVRGSKVCPTVHIRNGTASSISPKATVGTDGWFGGSSRTVSLAPMAPGDSGDVELGCVRRPIGPGKLRIRVQDPTGDSAIAAHLFWLPLPLLFSLLLLLLLIAALLTTFARGWFTKQTDNVPPDAALPSSKELDDNHPQ
jgi:hypothetical protein